MTTAANRNRFIPLRKSDLLTACLQANRLTTDQSSAFLDFARLLSATFHYEYHQRLERLMDCYAPFNPDADTREIQELGDGEKLSLQKKLVKELSDVLNAANFERITAQDLNEALTEESLFKIRLEVDFDDFEEVLFFRRGESIRKETLVRWLGLVKKPISFTHYDRVAVFIKFKGVDYFAGRNSESLYFTPGSTLIKLFKNVPKSDLEMLFPNSQVRMKTIDKVILGVPAAISGIIVVATKLGASLVLVAALIAFWLGLKKEEVMIDQQHLVALGVGLAALAGFLFRQYNKFKNRKIRFMKTLADNLYFKNLDNNAGVLFHLINEAEEEDFKEAVLAYFFLLTEQRKMTAPELDETIEKWLNSRFNLQSNFEIEDALAKLERLHLIQRHGALLSCKSLPEAKQQLDNMWDDLFQYPPHN